MFRILSISILSSTILFSCQPKIGKNSTPPGPYSSERNQKNGGYALKDTIQGRVKINKTFNSSHFVQMIDGETTILKAVLYQYEPPEGMKDGGEQTTIYTQILQPESIKVGTTYSIDSKLFRNRLELINDPGYDAFEQSDLVGEIKFISIIDKEEYIYTISVGEKGNEKLYYKNILVQCKK